MGECEHCKANGTKPFGFVVPLKEAGNAYLCDRCRDEHLRALIARLRTLLARARDGLRFLHPLDERDRELPAECATCALLAEIEKEVRREEQ